MVVSAQSGKSETFLDIIGERLDTSPVPVIYVGPSKQFLSEQWEPRVKDLMDNTSLRDRLGTDRQMTKTRKVINGVPLRLAHGGSSTAMKSDPFGLAFTDEADEMMSNLRGQGNPIGLIDARGDTYSDFVHAITSTPSKGSTEVEVDPETGLEFWADSDPEEIESTVWRLWLSGTRYHWAWPCPHCEEYFIPRFNCLAWDKPERERGREGRSSASLARRTAHLLCPRCGCEIEEDSVDAPNTNLGNKEWMNSRGVYVAPGQNVLPSGEVVGNPPESWTVSFWVSGLASPFVTWGERAARYVEAVRSGQPSEIQSVRNQGFGELWAPGSGTAPEWAEVKAKALPTYKSGEVPDEAIVLTLACDVQTNRLVYTIRGWGAGAESWLIVADEIYGPTHEVEVWDALASVITDTYDGLPIKLALIDSGFRPGKKDMVPEHMVYAFAKKFPGLVRATKGSSTPMRKPIMSSKIDINLDGREIKGGLDLLRIDPDYCKSWVQQKVKWDPKMPGAWHLPADIDEEFCRQVVSEARLKAPGGKVKWVVRYKENHFLDCEAMQCAAQLVLNLSKLRGRPRPRRAEPDPSENSRKRRAPKSGGGPPLDDIWGDTSSLW